MQILDNINNLWGNDLKQPLKPGAKLKIAASCFSIYAFEALKKELERIDSIEFIFTAPAFVPNEVTDKVSKERREFHIPKQQRERNLYGSEFEIQLKNKLTQRAIAKECADWIRRKARFRSNFTKAPMQQFACINKGDGAVAYMPLHGFTAVDLGYQQGDAVSNFITKFDDAPSTQTWLNLFNQIWGDASKLKDVTDAICAHIESVYHENSPEKIYFLMLYNIFNEFLEDLNEDLLPNDLTGYKKSVVWNKLFNFQRDAATGLINKLENYNGCILADSVGLGKTFTALAVIKYYELRNRSVLALCPKKLADNWLNYNRNLKTNILANDRLNYDVLCHTELLGDYSLEKKTNGNNMGYIPPVYDFILCYAKNANDDCLIGFPLSHEFLEANYANPDNDPKGPWTTSDLSANHEGPLFEITNPNTGKKYWPAKGRYWVFNKTEVKKRIADGRIIFGKTGQAGPVQKKYLSARDSNRMKPESWWDSHGLNSDETAEVASLFTPKIFDHPKPVTLLRKIIDISTKNNDLILDYFAGSGSTAHAVIAQNLEDSGSRRFIAVQYPEKPGKKSEVFKEFGLETIADLCKERIRRAGKKIKEENATTAPDLDSGFRGLKVDSSNMADVYYTPDAVVQKELFQSTDNIKDDRTSEDLLFQILLDWGVDLTLPITKETIEDREVFFVDGNALAACFEKGGKITEDFCKEIAGRQPLRVVFRDSGFKNDSVKINVEQIFKLISPQTEVKTI